MARKRHPNSVIDQFVSDSDRSFERFQSLYEILSLLPENEQRTERQALAVDAAFRLGVLWETFLHEWHVAAAAKDQTRLMQRCAATLASIPGEAQDLLELLSIVPELPRHLSLPQVEALLNASGTNLTFRDMREWKSAAKNDLVNPYVGAVLAVANDDESASTIELLRSLRNLLAHGSKSAKESFNRSVRRRQPGQRIGLVGNANELLMRQERQVHDPGPYLNRIVLSTPMTRRVGVLYGRVSEIAELLRV